MNYSKLIEKINDVAEHEIIDTSSKIFQIRDLHTIALNSKELTDDEKALIEEDVLHHLNQLIGITETSKEGGTVYKELPISYGEIASASIKSIKGVDHFWGDFKGSFAQWYCQKYLPTFHPMPYPEIQYPCLTACTLMNPNAVLIDEEGTWVNKLPFIYLLGIRGSGKSEYAKQMVKFFPKNSRIMTDVSFTGASMRESLDPVCSTGKPAILLYDNLQPQETVRSLGRLYTIFLQNEKEYCVTRISKHADDDGDGAFEFYCSKIVTSIFDMEYDTDPKSQEMLRRFIIFCFERALQTENHKAYNWSQFEEHYYALWTDIDNLKENYFPILHELEMMSPKLVPSIDAAMWDLVKLPIATGVYSGLWQSVWDGINAFALHLNSLPKMKSAVKDLLAQIVDQFVNQYYPGYVLNNKDNFPDLDVDLIEMEKLQAYIQQHQIPFSGRDKKDVIPRLLSEYGYTSKFRGNKTIYVRGE